MTHDCEGPGGKTDPDKESRFLRMSKVQTVFG
jgi:hypothetical protein